MDLFAALLVICILLVVFCGLLYGIASATRAPRTVPALRREAVVTPRRAFEGGLETEHPSDGSRAVEPYRGHPGWSVVERQVPVNLPVRELPPATLHAATGCRIAAVVAGLFALPVFLGAGISVAFADWNPLVVLGLPGLALAIGQVQARRRVFGAPRTAARTLVTVGLWTLVHNVGVLGAVVFCSLKAPKGIWAFLAFDVAGWTSVLYAVVSLLLGLQLMAGGRALRKWAARSDLGTRPTTPAAAPASALA